VAILLTGAGIFAAWIAYEKTFEAAGLGSVFRKFCEGRTQLSWV
jgi:hypothetical protein